MPQSVVKLSHISKQYYLHSQKPTFVENLMHPFNKQEFLALDNVNLTIHRGERVAIIGSNGSGKTTLLKIITGITRPSKGTVQTQGKVISLIELTAGFQAELSGIENMYINGMLLGMLKKEIDELKKDIINFADIGDFIYQPVFTYSHGMMLRLGFAIAINAHPDILVIDANISAGDYNFQQKIEQKYHELIDQKTTLIFVSHQYHILKKYCKKFIWLHKSKVKKIGDEKILDEYHKFLWEETQSAA